MNRNDRGIFGPTAIFDLDSYEPRPGKTFWPRISEDGQLDIFADGHLVTSTPCDPDELVKLVNCPKCGFKEAELTYYSAIDGGTINNHKRFHCVMCERVTDTRDY